MTATAAPAALSSLNLLPRTPRMPVLFLGHGSPMNVITDNPWRGVWQGLGTEFGAQAGAKWPKPALILCVSAHWLTRGWWLTGQAQPKTVHDFGGFPQALFDQRYPAPGAPGAARELAEQLKSPAGPMPVKLDVQEWGYDHGCWSVLKPMFPAADIPVLQLSMDYSRPPAEHYALGQQLKGLRERGVLIVGSGNIVHNLRAVQRQAPDNQTYDWALEFDAAIARQIREGDLAGLAQFAQLGRAAQLSHPTHDHLLPLLYCAGAVQAGEPLRFVNEGFQIASISMRSVVWG